MQCPQRVPVVGCLLLRQHRDIQMLSGVSWKHSETLLQSPCNTCSTDSAGRAGGASWQPAAQPRFCSSVRLQPSLLPAEVTLPLHSCSSVLAAVSLGALCSVGTLQSTVILHLPHLAPSYIHPALHFLQLPLFPLGIRTDNLPPGIHLDQEYLEISVILLRMLLILELAPI